MEKSFQFLPNTFKHFHPEKHVQNVDFHHNHHASHPSQQRHVPQIHEQSKSDNTTTKKSENAPDETHSVWTYLDPNHWFEHFKAINTSNKFEAINATRGLYISA